MEYAHIDAQLEIGTNPVQVVFKAKHHVTDEINLIL